MGNILIGREEEQRILQRALDSPDAEMVAVIGRRRVGKTFLIKSFYKKKILFEITGVQNSSPREQLTLFNNVLNEASNATIPLPVPQDWLEAFNRLSIFLESKLHRRKKSVIFFDELPWLAAQRSGFVKALGYFWNSWAVNQNIVIVICGSAASWMIKNIINNTGGLYNRVTKRIALQPFTLAETKLFLNSRGVSLPHYHLVQIYMAMGGIPHYLKEVEAGKSATQIIDQLCFSQNGLLRDEFSRLYPALFVNAENHLNIIRILATKKYGLTRQEIIQTGKLPNGGGLTKTLEELIQSGFVTSFQPFGKKIKDTLFRLTDEYSLFYLQFIEQYKNEGKQTWHLLSQTQSYKTWSGYAFENICLKHIPQIKKALGISGVFSTTSSFYKKGDKQEKGCQIDLVINRNDQVINLCEIKFYHEPFCITKKYAENLRNKISIFRNTTKTRKHLVLTLITTFGLKPNQHSIDLSPQSVTMDALFE